MNRLSEQAARGQKGMNSGIHTEQGARQKRNALRPSRGRGFFRSLPAILSVSVLALVCASAAALAGGAGPKAVPAPERTSLRGLARPAALAFDRRGNLYVAEQGETRGAGRIILRTPDNETILIADGLDSPAALAVDQNGGLLVALRGSGEILRIHKNGKRTVLARGLDRPATLALDRDGGIWVACGDGSLHRVERPQPSPPAR
ncbi:NHL repeat-containing protein [Paucidesulfovibrio longus]|uniref:hypothetical protein n=1 Tax=Paucidesulfovibrio longus TaxID=889 RepID=UPI0003B5CD7F|nr:hypothetical protein [Paucidesulfovibrio longus]